jgi:hypothetical protein
MPTLAEVMEGAAALKTGLDLFKSAIGLAKDVQSALPASKDTEAVGKALVEAEQAAAIAEAQMGQVLGFELCRKHFPPKVMLEVGHYYERSSGSRVAVFGCPACGQVHQPVVKWERTVPVDGSDEPTGEL